MKRHLLAAAAGLCAIVPASAQVTSIESSNPLPAKVEGDPGKIICERIVRTGSRLASEKVCMTAQQWQDLKSGQRHDFEEVQRIVNQGPSDPSCAGAVRC